MSSESSGLTHNYIQVKLYLFILELLNRKIKVVGGWYTQHLIHIVVSAGRVNPTMVFNLYQSHHRLFLLPNDFSASRPMDLAHASTHYYSVFHPMPVSLQCYTFKSIYIHLFANPHNTPVRQVGQLLVVSYFINKEPESKNGEQMCLSKDMQVEMAGPTMQTGFLGLAFLCLPCGQLPST